MAVFAAMIFDTLDGRIARLTHTESAFGKEYDSLADMVAFGVAPAIVAYQWGVVRIAEYGQHWGRFGWLACFFYAVAAALRLARFNARSASADKRYFEGLPSPSAAAIVAAFVWFCSDWREPRLTGLIVAFAVTATAGALMVSSFGYPSFKQFDLDRRIRFVYMLLVPLAFVLIAGRPADDAAADVRQLRAVGPAAVGLAGACGAGGAARPGAGARREPWTRRAASSICRRSASTCGCRARRRERPRRGGAAGSAPPRPPRREHGGALGARSRAEVRSCTRCPLHADAHAGRVRRRRPQRATGWSSARRPGAEEDRRASPSSAAPGSCSNAMLRAIGLDRASNVYIANVLKSRPPGNRDPKPEEVAACLPYLHAPDRAAAAAAHAGGRAHRGAEPARHRHAARPAARPGASLRRIRR